MNRPKRAPMGEMPIIAIGKFEISMMTDASDKTIWIKQEDGVASEFDAKDLEPVIEKFFNTNF